MPTLAPYNLSAGLREAHMDALHVAAGKIKNAMEDRDEAIREAYRDGMPASLIAEKVGLSRQRVHQIVSYRAVHRLHGRANLSA